MFPYLFSLFCVKRRPNYDKSTTKKIDKSATKAKGKDERISGGVEQESGRQGSVPLDQRAGAGGRKGAGGHDNATISVGTPHLPNNTCAEQQILAKNELGKRDQYIQMADEE